MEYQWPEGRSDKDEDDTWLYDVMEKMGDYPEGVGQTTLDSAVTKVRGSHQRLPQNDHPGAEEDIGEGGITI